MRVSCIAPFVSAALLALAGCQDPDVGQPCTFDIQGVLPSTIGVDFLETGKTECENLVCMVSPTVVAGSKVAHNPYCSKVCVSDADCSQGDTGLQCRKVILDETFLNALDPATKQRYLPGNTFTNYCAAPLH